MKNTFFIIALFLISFISKASCEEKDMVIKKGSDIEIDIRVYNPDLKSDRLIVIFPPTGGVNFIDRNYARYFCRNDIKALIVKGWKETFEMRYDLDVHIDYYKTAQRSIDTVFEYYSDYKIGLLGTSLGAIHASISFARNDFIDKVFLVVGGGNLASMIATTDQEQTLEFKKIRFELFGFESEEEYEQALRPYIPYEVLDMEIVREGRDIGMVVSTNDVTVPTENQKSLKNKWNPDVIFTSSWNHVNTVVKTWMLNSDEILEFFQN